MDSSRVCNNQMSQQRPVLSEETESMFVVLFLKYWYKVVGSLNTFHFDTVSNNHPVCGDYHYRRD